ncbi:MAG: hypothetical protein MSH31_05685, partial [Clostridiales bacterium]|nr:hypothetical protein [Clostridiales bacterium]
APPQRTPRVDEVESRGWGRRAPQSPSSSSFGAPQGNNKIYKCDVVFRIGEARKKVKGITPIPYKKSKEIRRLQVKAPACKYTEAARRGTGCQGIPVPAAPYVTARQKKMPPRSGFS